LGSNDLQKIKELMIKNNLSLDDIKKSLVSNESLLNNDELLELFFSEKQYVTTTYTNMSKALHDLIAYLDNQNLLLVSTLEARNYLRFLNKRNLSKNTKMAYLTRIKAFYNYVLDELDYLKLKAKQIYNKTVMIYENPFPTRHKFSGREHVFSQEILEIDEILPYLKLLRKIFSFRHYLMFKLILTSSCRINGLCNLLLDRVDFKLRQFETFDKGRERRYVFDVTTRDELILYLKIRKQYRVNSPFLFVDRYETQFNPNAIQQIYFQKKKLIEEEFGKRVLTTNLRKTFRTLRMVLGQDSKVIECLMARKKRDLESIYTRLRGRNLTKVYDDFDFMTHVY